MTDTTVDLPVADLPFHVEQHGIDLIPASERWARPRDLGALWAGASINVEYFVYGALLMTFGFSLPQAIVLIVVGNLSWLLVGLCSLQGPTTGTTTFGVNRAAFGPRGSRGIALFNWLTMIGFEVEGLILIVGAALVLSGQAGLHPGTPLKVAIVLAAVGVQTLLPLFGHATMTTVLRWMILPFVGIFAVVALFALPHVHSAAGTGSGVTWQLWSLGLAFTITLSGLSWTECGNDYSRYLPASASRRATTGWVFAGTALPQIAVMTIGALAFSALGASAGWTGANPFTALQGQHVLPGWFVSVFMLAAIVQLFGVNSLDLYSSGVTLQAVGLRLRRHQAVILDSSICLVITLYAVFSSSFASLLRDFVALVIVWIAPWCAVYLVDWALRRGRYDVASLARTDRTSTYWATDGVNVPAILGLGAGMLAALLTLNSTVPMPSWLHPFATATASDASLGALSGGDVSVFAGMLVAGAVYLVAERATGLVRRQVGVA
jgi:purine-cytosine permease-like protein